VKFERPRRRRNLHSQDYRGENICCRALSVYEYEATGCFILAFIYFDHSNARRNGFPSIMMILRSRSGFDWCDLEEVKALSNYLRLGRAHGSSKKEIDQPYEKGVENNDKDLHLVLQNTVLPLSIVSRRFLTRVTLCPRALINRDNGRVERRRGPSAL